MKRTNPRSSAHLPKVTISLNEIKKIKKIRIEANVHVDEILDPNTSQVNKTSKTDNIHSIVISKYKTRIGLITFLLLVKNLEQETRRRRKF